MAIEFDPMRSLVNDIRPLLARLSSGIHVSDCGGIFKRISDMAKLYDRGLFYGTVFEICNQQYNNDSIFLFLAMCLLLPREYYLAVMIFKFFSNDDLIQVIDVICSLKSSEIGQIKINYHSLFESEIEVDIETHTLGNDRKLLLRHTSGPPGTLHVGKEQLENVVRYLHEKVQETHNCPELAIMDRVYELKEDDLREVVAQYSKKHGKPLVEDLTRAGDGPFEHGLLTKIRCAVNRPEFLAEKLYTVLGDMIDPDIEGMTDADHNIDYETIVRVITTVAKGDMMMMQEKYRLKSESTLRDDISEAFAGHQDCLHLILMILNGNAPN